MDARQSRVSGFTLIELLVVLAVLGILSMAVLPLAQMTVQRERERELKQALWDIREAIDAYKRAGDTGAFPRTAGSSGYPANLQVLAEGVPDARRGGQKIYFLRRVPRDPFAPVDLPPERTWGLRSYASPPDRPEAGADVFDVHSTSGATGLNGVPLRQW